MGKQSRTPKAVARRATKEKGKAKANQVDKDTEGKKYDVCDALKKKSIKDAIFRAFDKRGVENVTLAQATKLAITCKKNTAFNAKHLAWYKSKYAKETR